MIDSMSGKFITVDGIEGAGKTTQIAFIHDLLTRNGKPVVLTREPGGTPLAEEIRQLLLAKRADAMAADTELLLMFAARAEHLAKVIRPALAEGCWVISDRFTDASYAYQGGGRGVAIERIADLETWVQSALRPDLTLILDLPVNQGLQRVNRRSPKDRFESEDRDFFERVRSAYRQRALQSPARYRIVDTDQPLANIQQAIETIVTDFIIAAGDG